MNFNPCLLLFSKWMLLASSLMAVAGNADKDCLRNEAGTDTGNDVSASNAGSNRALADSDGVSVPDGMEVNIGPLPTNSARSPPPFAGPLPADDATREN